MSHWSDLVSTALVGTDRRPVPEPPPGSALSSVEPNAVAPADRLLDRAAAVTLARRAGHQPQRDVTLPPPAPAETVPTVPPMAAARLDLLLREQPRGQQSQQQRATLISEWLGLAAHHHLVVPGRLLPLLLDEARTRQQWRPLVAATGGARATWLAGQNPAWSWLLDTADHSIVDDESVWHEGAPAQRLSYLVSLRERDPEKARRLLDESWPDEPPAARAAFLSAWDRNLSLADEPLLERALDDRRKEVRVVAVGLLAGLDGCAYQGRMAERALSYLALAPGGELVVTPPAECDRAMRRDGIEPKPPQGTGERAWWFEQVLVRTPLSVWRAIDGDPAALLRLAVADDWIAVVHRGWAQATVEQHEHSWAAAFVDSTSPAMARRPPAAGALTQAVHRQLAPTDAIAVALRMLEAADPYLEFVLPSCPRPWPDRLAATALTQLRAYGEGRSPLLSTLVTLAAFGLPPSAAPAAVRLAQQYQAEQGDGVHGPFYDRLADTLTFRHQMHREFE